MISHGTNDLNIHSTDQLPNVVLLLQIINDYRKWFCTHFLQIKWQQRSNVWKFYTQDSSNSVVCKVCEKRLAYHGCTSNLHDHLERQHSHIYKPSIKDIRPIATVEREVFQNLIYLLTL